MWDAFVDWHYRHRVIIGSVLCVFGISIATYAFGAETLLGQKPIPTGPFIWVYWLVLAPFFAAEFHHEHRSGIALLRKRDEEARASRRRRRRHA